MQTACGRIVSGTQHFIIPRQIVWTVLFVAGGCFLGMFSAEHLVRALPSPPLAARSRFHRARADAAPICARALAWHTQRGQHVVHKLKEKNDGVKVTNNRLRLEKTEYKARRPSSPPRPRSRERAARARASLGRKCDRIARARADLGGGGSRSSGT